VRDAERVLRLLMIDALVSVRVPTGSDSYTRVDEGLAPSSPQNRGRITKTGSTHARRLLVEASWHYKKTPTRGVSLQRRQEGQPATVVAISWQAQQRLHRVWRRLCDERGKRSTIVAVAVARELAGFCWALAATD
jgi:hypothetical protein